MTTPNTIDNNGIRMILDSDDKSITIEPNKRKYKTTRYYKKIKSLK